MSEPIRLLTWNVWGRVGISAKRQRAIQRCLDALRPDILTLQEVCPVVAGPTFAQSLADRYELHLATGIPGQGEIGRLTNAILSRWPIRHSEEAALPCHPGQDEQRTVLHALVEHPRGRLPLFTTHFNSAPGASEVRCEQARFVCRFVAERRSDLKAVVTGDLNAEPESDELRLLGGHQTTPPVAGFGLIDTWRWAEPGDPGWTWDPRNPHVAESFDVGARVDFVLTEIAPGSRRVRDVRVVAGAPMDGTWPSDHSAVVVELWP